jgi:hypothetical protein
MARSSALYFRKYARGWQWAIVLPYRIASAAKTLLRLLLNGRVSSAHAYCRGLFDGLRL